MKNILIIIINVKKKKKTKILIYFMKCIVYKKKYRINFNIIKLSKFSLFSKILIIYL